MSLSRKIPQESPEHLYYETNALALYLSFIISPISIKLTQILTHRHHGISLEKEKQESEDSCFSKNFTSDGWTAYFYILLYPV